MPLVVTAPIFGGDARRSEALAKVRPEPTLGLHPDTASSLGLAQGAQATVTSAHGACELPVTTDAALAADVAYVPVGLGGGVGHLLPADHGAVLVSVAKAAS